LSLPILSWRDVLKVLSKKGFRPVRQRGSHIIIEDAEGNFATVPRKNEIKRGTLLSIIEEAGLTKNEFLELLG
jgi:predicted RNA binding protein YcfA (HicA-like mRNA interferase family)